ncbi:unnamed protein product, partial [Ectocarpus sp. 8 AP-2014]
MEDDGGGGDGDGGAAAVGATGRAPAHEHPAAETRKLPPAASAGTTTPKRATRASTGAPIALTAKGSLYKANKDTGASSEEEGGDGGGGGGGRYSNNNIINNNNARRMHGRATAAGPLAPPSSSRMAFSNNAKTGGLAISPPTLPRR